MQQEKSKESRVYSLSVVINNKPDSEITSCMATANFPALQSSFDALEVVSFAIQILASSRLQAGPAMSWSV